MIRSQDHHMSKANLLTIKEAASLSGKAEITVRRFVNTIVKDDAHADRSSIEPSVKEVKALKKGKKPFSWKIDEKLIKEKLITDTAKKVTKKNVSKAHAETPDSVLETLQTELKNKEDQLRVKDDQIKALTEVMQSLNERMREGNVLMASLQKQLQGPSAEENVVDVKPQKPGKQKKSWFEWLFE